MTLEVRLWVIAAGCLVAFAVLAYAIAHSVAPWRIDVEGAALRGQATPLALLFTGSGRALPLLAIAIIGVTIAVTTRVNTIAAIWILVTQALSQGAVEVVKHLLMRSRPDEWLVHDELGFSFPSGHATTAVVFFGSWLIMVASAPLPKSLKLGVIAILAIWIVGIDWSRLALGAHYPTDVIGGTLFGAAWACTLWALLLHFRLLPIV